jgi:hypothetical protein
MSWDDQQVAEGALRARDLFYGPGRWSEKAPLLAELRSASTDPLVRKYVDRARSIAKFTWEAGDVDILGSDGEWKPFGDPQQQPYGLKVRDQAGGLARLEELEAIQGIFQAVTAHCEEFRPSPPYKPELLKARLQALGWTREARVPPPSEDLDKLPINDRFDALKFFPSSEGEVGVAIEIEGWEINNDLLKFWRAHRRGQIAVGVLIQPDPATLHYCFDQMRLLTEPLFEQLPIVYIAPDGEGLKQHSLPKPKKLKPFPMPARGSPERS